MTRLLLLLSALLACLSAAASAQSQFSYDGQHKLWLFSPPHRRAATILYLGRSDGDPALPALFQKLGYGCALPELGEESPVEDAAAACAWLKSNLKSHGGDPDRLYVVGQGRGAQWAGLLCLDPRWLAGKGLLPSALRGGVSFSPDPPLPAVHLGSPPVLLVLGKGETPPKAVGQAVTLEDRHPEAWTEGLCCDNDDVQKLLRRFVAAHSPTPVTGLRGVRYQQSPNWGVRSLGGSIDTVVVHATVINTLSDTERIFLQDRGRRVSAHYVVDRDGTTVQMVDETMAAWHAGASELEGKSGVNDFSLGVELINLNDGKDPYTEAQYRALARIIRDLRTRWAVPDERIVSHAFIARPPGRKSDPLGFDFEKLRGMLSK